MRPRALAVLAVTTLLSTAVWAATPPAAPTVPAAPAPAATPAPVDPTSQAGLANYRKGLAGLKKIGQVIETGADWPLFIATHKAVQADPALRAKFTANAPKAN